MSSEVDPALELYTLVSALRAHAEYQANSGAVGLPPASAELRRSRQPDDLPMTPAPGAEPARQRRTEPVADGAPETPPAVMNREERLVPEPATGRAPAATRSEPSRAAVSAPEDFEQRTRSLAVLAERVRGCTACGLHEQRTQTVFARGTGKSRLCFVGEGPGADEDAQGEPFVGKAGQLLDRMIVAMGFSRDDVYVCNIVKCRPPNNRKPEPDEMTACRGYLEEQLALVRPEVIVALGATAVQGLLGTTGGITRLRGNWRLYKGEIAVMPTFHPAYLLRNPRAKRDVWDDLKEVLRHMGREVPNRS
jgi:DNA polymerase